MPVGPVAAATRVRIMEVYVSFQYLNHVISFGKQDEWQSPAIGGSMSYSNNAENIYAFHINRIEPLDVPLLSRLTGPFRYEFLVGPLKGTLIPSIPGYIWRRSVSGRRRTLNLVLSAPRYGEARTTRPSPSKVS